jgi:hypothetical protein
MREWWSMRAMGIWTKHRQKRMPQSFNGGWMSGKLGYRIWELFFIPQKLGKFWVYLTPKFMDIFEKNF